MKQYEGMTLRRYMAMIRRWLWLIVLCTMLAGGTALVIGSAGPTPTPVYQAESGVALVQSKEEILLGPQFSTLSEADLAMSSQDLLQALTILVENSLIASQVIEELGPTLDPVERNAEKLLNAVSTKTEGNLIKIVIRADSPQKAAAIANAWGRNYENYVNRLYGENPLNLDDLQHQVDEAQRSYQEAEEALIRFRGNNRIDELNREIEAKQALMASYKDAQITAQTQAAEAKKRYDQAEEALVQFLGDNRIDELEREIRARQNTLDDYYAAERQLDNLIGDAKALHDQLRQGSIPSSTLRDSLALVLLRANAAFLLSGKPAGLSFSTSAVVRAEDPAQQLAELDAFIANLEARRAAFQELINDSPLQQEILQLQEQREQEEAAKQELTQARDLAWQTYGTLAGEMAMLDVSASDPSSRLIDQYSQEVLQLQEQLEREQARQRELTSARDLAWETYQTLLRRMADVGVASQVQETVVRFAVPALEPKQPIKLASSKPNILQASLVGTMLAVGVASLIEYLDDTLRTPEDVQRTLGMVPLGTIAPLPADASDEPITVSQPRSPTAESFRALRTQLQMATDKPLGTILVTSPRPVEGKSTVAANLGTVMAQAGRSVIVIDADLRRPVLHNIFGLSNAWGLSSALSGDDLDVGRYLQATGVENLRVLTSGPLPPHPSELLGSPRTEELIEELKGQADVLVLDSPAALVVTDAVVLAQHMDGVLLVVKAGATGASAARQAVEALSGVGPDLLGVALNRFVAGPAAYYDQPIRQARQQGEGAPQPWAAATSLLRNVIRRIKGV